MALVPSTNVVDTAGRGSDKRFYPEGVGAVQGGQFASGSGTLAFGTVLAKNSSGNYIVWDGDATDITGKPVGFVYQPGGVVLSGSGEVMGTVMKAGRAHVDDIPLVAGSSGYTLAQIKAAGQNFLFRAIDIVIEGIINQGGGVPVDAIE